MSEVFGREYARLYDGIYQDKDYSGECRLIEQVFSEHAVIPTRSILDLGCGTGRHAFIFSEKGYAVTGVDRSEAMLSQAREKKCVGKGLNFIQGDVCDLQLGTEFDAALMMFAVLSYQTENHAVLATLTSTRRHLRRGGLLIFDAWFGPAVLIQKPQSRTRMIDLGQGKKILRTVDAELDVLRHICSVTIRSWQFEGQRILFESCEEHSMRFFFPLEITAFLKTAGFSLVRLGRFPDFDQDPDETSWNVLGVARAI